jgi:uncharacterized membrane protein required for colicin V production
MNLADILIMLSLCAGTMLGFYHGLIRTLFHMVLLYFVTIVAAFAYPSLAVGLGYLVPAASLQMRQVVAFLLLLLFLFNLLFFSTRASMKSRKLLLPAMVDKLGGMVAGFFMMSLWIAIGLILLDFILSLYWLQYEGIRQLLVNTFNTSPFASVIRSVLPYAVVTLKPWFEPFGGLPGLFLLR